MSTIHVYAPEIDAYTQAPGSSHFQTHLNENVLGTASLPRADKFVKELESGRYTSAETQSRKPSLHYFDVAEIYARFLPTEAQAEAFFNDPSLPEIELAEGEAKVTAQILLIERLKTQAGSKFWKVLWQDHKNEYEYHRLTVKDFDDRLKKMKELLGVDPNAKSYRAEYLTLLFTKKALQTVVAGYENFSEVELIEVLQRASLPPHKILKTLLYLAHQKSALRTLFQVTNLLKKFPPNEVPRQLEIVLNLCHEFPKVANRAVGIYYYMRRDYLNNPDGKDVSEFEIVSFVKKLLEQNSPADVEDFYIKLKSDKRYYQFLGVDIKEDFKFLKEVLPYGFHGLASPAATVLEGDAFRNFDANARKGILEIVSTIPNISWLRELTFQYARNTRNYNLSPDFRNQIVSNYHSLSPEDKRFIATQKWSGFANSPLAMRLIKKG